MPILLRKPSLMMGILIRAAPTPTIINAYIISRELLTHPHTHRCSLIPRARRLLPARPLELSSLRENILMTNTCY